MEMTASTIEERRRGADRRRQTTPMISRYSFIGGRRAGDRRSQTQEGVYVDQYDSTTLLFILCVALFNILDCFFTLVQLGRGARELNPFVNYLIEIGPGIFIFAKTFGIGIILAFLCLHKNFRLARGTLTFALVMYFLIFVYHVVIYAYF